MNNHPVHLLKPIFNFLDGLIRDEGDRLYILFFYLCLLAIGWILSGGLRRRFAPAYAGYGDHDCLDMAFGTTTAPAAARHRR
jgi:hypothetical protein